MHWEFTEHLGNGEENAEKWEKQPCCPLGIPAALSIFERRFWLGFTAPRRRVLHGQGGRNPRDAPGDPGRQTQQNQGFFSCKTRDFPAKQPRALPTSLRQARLSWSSKVSHGRPWQGRERLWSRRIPVQGDEHTLELPGISIREKLWAHPTHCEVVTWFEIKRGARGTAERSWRKEVTPESPGTPNPIQPLPPPLCSIFSS